MRSTLRVHPDFEIQVVAVDLLVRDPVAIAFDELSRPSVIDMREYSERRDENNGRTRTLEDVDENVMIDKASPYVDSRAGKATANRVRRFDFVPYIPEMK